MDSGVSYFEELAFLHSGNPYVYVVSVVIMKKEDVLLARDFKVITPSSFDAEEMAVTTGARLVQGCVASDGSSNAIIILDCRGVSSSLESGTKSLTGILATNEINNTNASRVTLKWTK